MYAMTDLKTAEKAKIVKNLLRLGSLLRREGDRLLCKVRLNQQSFIVLKQIQEKGSVSQKDICSELLYEKSNISRIIKKLLDRKLISRTYSSEDGRVNSLKITDAGERTVEQCMALLNRWNGRWLTPLSDSEARQTVRALEKLGGIEGLPERFSRKSKSKEA